MRTSIVSIFFASLFFSSGLALAAPLPTATPSPNAVANPKFVQSIELPPDLQSVSSDWVLRNVTRARETPGWEIRAFDWESPTSWSATFYGRGGGSSASLVALRKAHAGDVESSLGPYNVRTELFHGLERTRVIGQYAIHETVGTLSPLSSFVEWNSDDGFERHMIYGPVETGRNTWDAAVSNPDGRFLVFYEPFQTPDMSHLWMAENPGGRWDTTLIAARAAGLGIPRLIMNGSEIVGVLAAERGEIGQNLRLLVLYLPDSPSLPWTRQVIGDGRTDSLYVGAGDLKHLQVVLMRIGGPCKDIGVFRLVQRDGEWAQDRLLGPACRSGDALPLVGMRGLNCKDSRVESRLVYCAVSYQIVPSGNNASRPEDWRTAIFLVGPEGIALLQDIRASADAIVGSPGNGQDVPLLIQWVDEDSWISGADLGPPELENVGPAPPASVSPGATAFMTLVGLMGAILVFVLRRD
jgi:hypothetical protein